MTNKLKLIVAGLLIITGSQLHAQSFIKPIVYYVNPSVDGYSNALAVGFSGGTYFGDKKQHELSFEWAYTHWDSEYRSPSLNINTRESFMPYLLNYKFRMGDTTGESSKTIFYVGPSIGMTNFITDASATGTTKGSASNSDWVFTYGGSIGMIVSLGQKIELDFGYRYLKMAKESDFNLGSVRFVGVESSANIIYGGLGIKF